MILYVQWNLKTECDETAQHRSCLCWFECLFLISFSGLLVAYCHRFDILTQSSRIYFVACTVGMYVCRGSSEGYNGKCFVRVTVCFILSHDWTFIDHLCCLCLSCFLSAYGIGLLITFVALAVMQMGQPALLYLVPCTLLTSLTVALWRRELPQFWTGSGFVVNTSLIWLPTAEEQKKT